MKAALLNYQMVKRLNYLYWREVKALNLLMAASFSKRLGSIRMTLALLQLPAVSVRSHISMEMKENYGIEGIRLMSWQQIALS
jgi:hypothetical protein